MVKKPAKSKKATPQETQALEAESVRPAVKTKAAPKRPPRTANALKPAEDSVIDLEEDNDTSIILYKPAPVPKPKAKKAVKPTTTSALIVTSTPITRSGLRSNPDDAGTAIRTSLFEEAPKAKKKLVNADAVSAILPHEAQVSKKGKQASEKPPMPTKKSTLGSASVDKVMPAPAMRKSKVCMPPST
jgi:hypothetical protein